VLIQGDWSNPTELLTHLGRDHFLFVLTGRFGNQLLGMSDAHLISKLTERKALLFFGNGVPVPDWIYRLKDSTWFKIFSGSFADSPPVTGETMLGLTDHSPLSRNSIFHGFTPSIAIHRKSGWLTSTESLFNLESQPKVGQLAITVRRGDYDRNPHLGTLPKSYYRKALKKLGPKIREFEKVMIYVDNPDLVSDLRDSWLSELGEIVHSDCALCDWESIRSATFAISSNSTYSYSARLSKTDSTIFPNPFFLNYDCDLLDDNSNTAPHSFAPKARFAILRIKKRFSKGSLEI